MKTVADTLGDKRFGTTRAPYAIEHLSDNGSAYTHRAGNKVVRPGPEPRTVLHPGD